LRQRAGHNVTLAAASFASTSSAVVVRRDGDALAIATGPAFELRIVRMNEDAGFAIPQATAVWIGDAPRYFGEQRGVQG